MQPVDFAKEKPLPLLSLLPPVALVKAEEEQLLAPCFGGFKIYN